MREFETYFDAYPWLLIPAITIGIVAWFCFVLFVLSRFGWYRFTEHHASSAPSDLSYVGISSARMGLISYNNCIILSCNSKGILFKPMLLFAFAHKPLFIPFDQIKITEKKTFGIQMVKLILKDENVPKISLSRKTWEKLKSKSGFQES